MYFEEPKHDPVSSAFLTEAQKNTLVIVIIFKKKKRTEKQNVSMSFESATIQKQAAQKLPVEIYIYVCMQA
jgi:uncharacterized protein YeaC (DUF1315 family)